jgi:aryl-alcohol dehydrogenase-like predicted oxidoreductase
VTLQWIKRRLRTDYIDLYQIHWPDPLVPIEQVAAELQGMYREGKIRAIGVSNFNPAQMDAFRAIAPLHTVQPPYNLFERGIDVDVLPYAARSGLSVLAYGALCRGLLTGRITAQTQFSGDDLRRSDPKFANAQRRMSCLSAVHALDAFGAMGWRLDAEAMTSIDRILERNIATPLGAEFMAPPPRSAATGEPSPTAAATAYAK